MKIVNFKYKDEVSVGFIKDGYVIPLSEISKNKQHLLKEDNFFKNFQKNKIFFQKSLDKINVKKFLKISQIELLSPIIKPNSLRDAYAFRQHVEAGRKSRNLPMIPEYDEFPVYYYGNHNSILGPGTVEIQNEFSDSIDFELEVAAIIGKEGSNIDVSDADNYILGYTIMNDFSSRKIQKKEMKMSLGPVKGKDFLTTLGPIIITKDELENCAIDEGEGLRYNLELKALLNGELISSDNFKNISWTFAQIISQISKGVTIFPGDVIGSGTCATGCLLELNQTNKTDRWLNHNDVISLSVEKIGTLENKIKII